ncbi:LacI family DNA-binding transcriptional regulator [Actinotalea sp. M2MS4P-6]|uniref:LacI family DNA-binding transcriptional regulator n=1 Tax=Actinotalea sp. M2MS4P-6 TaxID=2983762 RepID=UPI0021E36DD3|nr:LacI family DNA-binding transcriptional regulator [Actinotalea sp. M2MS4P-6]MCV2393222.1 LacI family DNA-binding transcriptional regulator [Actinotalea sp. M2MS4P-6]
MGVTPSRGRRKTGPSIEDVARLAGVSAQTVSRVSTGANVVRPDTRERVLLAMQQLGYAPNRAARALRSGTYGTIGLVAHRFGRTGEALTTEALVRAAEAEDYSVTLLTVQNPAEGWEPAAHRLPHQAIDGLVIIRAERATADSLALPVGMPIAVSDSRFGGHYPSVVADQVQGSIDAVRHLLDLGHQTVHHVAGPEVSEPARVRAGAWRRCLEEAGRRPPPVWQGDWSAESGYQAGLGIALDPAVTAVYCANDEMAFGVMRALHEAGRRVPEDVSVVGFDAIGLSGYSYPPLTTVRQDFTQMGRELVRLVLDQVRSGARAGHERVLVPTELVVRGTTAPPRA